MWWERACVAAAAQDHPATLYAARTDEKYDQLAVTSQIYDKKGNIRIQEVINYAINRRGPLATTGCDRGAFVSTTGACALLPPARASVGVALVRS